MNIEFKEFAGTDAACDKIYENPAYDGFFVVRTNEGKVYTVTLGWEQGWGNNYRFYLARENSADYFSPSEITHVEVK